MRLSSAAPGEACGRCAARQGWIRRQPDYTIMNVRFGLNPEGSHWLAELYVKNLTDKNAIIYTSTGNFDLRQTTNEPRVYGLRVNYRFGKMNNSE